MNSVAKAPDRTPGLVSYYNTEGSPPPGKVDVSVNVLDVHDVSVPRAALATAHAAHQGLEFELIGTTHRHQVTLSPAQVGALVATGHLELWSHFAAGHLHKVNLSPGDGTAAHDIYVGSLRVAKTWVRPAKPPVKDVPRYPTHLGADCQPWSLRVASECDSSLRKLTRHCR